MEELRQVLKTEVKKIMQEHNSFFKVPKKYKEAEKMISDLKRSNRLLVALNQIPHANETCCAFLQDMGIILFNQRSKKICLNPQVIAKALACFVMPKEHEKEVYGEISSAKDPSILSYVRKVN